MPVTLDLSGASTRFKVQKPQAQLHRDSLQSHIFKIYVDPGSHKLISNKEH